MPEGLSSTATFCNSLNLCVSFSHNTEPAPHLRMIASGPGPIAERTYLFAADIGDNGASREHVVVYRMIEPDLAATSTSADAVTLMYPDRPHDAEAFMVDPITGEGLYYAIRSADRIILASPIFFSSQRAQAIGFSPSITPARSPGSGPS